MRVQSGSRESSGQGVAGSEGLIRVEVEQDRGGLVEGDMQEVAWWNTMDICRDPWEMHNPNREASAGN